RDDLTRRAAVCKGHVSLRPATAAMSVEAELPLMCGLCGKSVSQGPSHPGELARPALALCRAEIDPDRSSCSGNGKPGRQRPERGQPALDVRLEDCALPRGLEVTRPEPLGG